jgi:hypothetical protein
MMLFLVGGFIGSGNDGYCKCLSADQIYTNIDGQLKEVRQEVCWPNLK